MAAKREQDGDRGYPVFIETVGQNFATRAVVTIDGTRYVGEPVPFGFEAAAIQRLLDKLNEKPS